jgi:hypothetical protein
MQQIFQANGSIPIPVPNEPHIHYWYNAVSRTFWMDVSATNKDEPMQQVTDSVKLIMLERFKSRHLRQKTFCVIS